MLYRSVDKVFQVTTIELVANSLCFLFIFIVNHAFWLRQAWANNQTMYHTRAGGRALIEGGECIHIFKFYPTSFF